MFIRSLLAIALTAAVTACGGGSSGSSSDKDKDEVEKYVKEGGEMPNSDSRVEPNQSAITYEQAEAVCGNVPVTEDAYDIQDHVGNLRATPYSSEAGMYIEESSGNICIDGDLSLLSFYGFEGNVFVSGDLTMVEIMEASGANIYLFGSVDTILISSSDTDVTVYASEAKSIYNYGNQPIKPMSAASL